MKKIKIYAEVPEDWIEAQRAEDLGAWLKSGRDMLINKSMAKIVDKIVEVTKVPKIKISKKELKKAVLEKMAERAIEND